MRILVTKTGDDLMKEMSIEHNETLYYKKIENNQRRLNQSKRVKSSSKSKSPKSSNVSFINNKNQNSKSKNNKIESLRSTQRTLDQENKHFLDKENLNNSKRISIKQKRLHIPKYITQKYNDDRSTGFILPDLTISKRNNNADNKNNNINKSGSPETRNNYTFREIISEDAYAELKSKLKKEKKIKDALSRIDESKFRSVYGEHDKSIQLEGMLDKTINANKMTLIKYINQNQKISDNFIKKVCESDDEKIIKTNKICQIVFHNKEKDKLLNDIIKERIRHKKNKEKTEYKVGLENMDETLKDFSLLLSNYNRKASGSKFGKYKDIHSDVVNNYWRRYNVDNLMFKTIGSRSKARNPVDSVNPNFSKTQGVVEIDKK